ncbi:hypothetical protein HYX17_02540 [Candidatus Woesearchaeota archaeon]|nr:hypothetical protein [Candidatus Woesearchaeota archaeon]
MLDNINNSLRGKENEVFSLFFSQWNNIKGFSKIYDKRYPTKKNGKYVCKKCNMSTNSPPNNKIWRCENNIEKNEKCNQKFIIPGSKEDKNYSNNPVVRDFFDKCKERGWLDFKKIEKESDRSSKKGKLHKVPNDKIGGFRLNINSLLDLNNINLSENEKTKRFLELYLELSEIRDIVSKNIIEKLDIFTNILERRLIKQLLNINLIINPYKNMKYLGILNYFDTSDIKSEDIKEFRYFSSKPSKEAKKLLKQSMPSEFIENIKKRDKERKISLVQSIKYFLNDPKFNNKEERIKKRISIIDNFDLLLSNIKKDELSDEEKEILKDKVETFTILMSYYFIENIVEILANMNKPTLKEAIELNLKNKYFELVNKYKNLPKKFWEEKTYPFNENENEGLFMFKMRYLKWENKINKSEFELIKIIYIEEISKRFEVISLSLLKLLVILNEEFSYNEEKEEISKIKGKIIDEGIKKFKEITLDKIKNLPKRFEQIINYFKNESQEEYGELIKRLESFEN